jgi:hypothetical protein
MIKKNLLPLFLLIPLFIASQDLGGDLSLGQSVEKKEDKTYGTQPSPLTFAGFFRHMLHTAADSDKTILTSSHILNVSADYLAGPFRSHLSVTQHLSFSNHMERPLFDLYWNSRLRNRPIPDLYRNRSSDALLLTEIHRGYFQYKEPQFYLKIGRQAVSWGEGRFINPLNLVTPISPFILDTELLPGADCLNLHYFFTPFNSLQLVIVPHHRENETNPKNLKPEDTDALVRTQFTVGSVDISAVTGYHLHSYPFGAEANATVLDASIRFSALARLEKEHPELQTATGKYRSPRKWIYQGVLGGSYAFFGGKLRTTLEVFYNSRTLDEDDYLQKAFETEALISSGLADPLSGDPTFFAASGRFLTRNPLFAELSLGYKPHILLDTQLFLMGDIQGKSLYLSPLFTYSLTQHADLVLSGNFFLFKNKDSEFEGRENQIFGYLKWYF